MSKVFQNIETGTSQEDIFERKEFIKKEKETELKSLLKTKKNDLLFFDIS